jgi:hypothetical protein
MFWLKSLNFVTFIHGICFIFVGHCRAFDAHMAHIEKARTIMKKFVAQCMYEMWSLIHGTTLLNFKDYLVHHVAHTYIVKSCIASLRTNFGIKHMNYLHLKHDICNFILFLNEICYEAILQVSFLSSSPCYEYLINDILRGLHYIIKIHNFIGIYQNNLIKDD